MPLQPLRGWHKQSPGLVVKGGDSCSRGRGYKLQHRILDGNFQINLLIVKIKYVQVQKISQL